MTIRYLWLTFCDPDPPINGQFIYSGGLIRAVANANVDLTVLGLSRQEGPTHRRREPRTDWQLAEDRQASKWSKLLSSLPLLTLRSRVPDMEAAVTAHLAKGDWDAVVFDSITGAWALSAVLRYRKRHPQAKVVYVAHNVESTVAWHLAGAERGWKRPFKMLDAFKMQCLERRLLRAADLLMADAPDICATLEAMSGEKPVRFLPPGYGGSRMVAKTIGSSLPRRAVLVGSFDWPPKRVSLETFLTAAVAPFSSAGIELQVVGRTEASYVAALRRRFPSIGFVGTVQDLRPYMAEARIALVPDLLGAFKLKTLDYVFNRLPIFAIDGAVPGTPLENGRAIRLYRSHEALAHGVVAAIDDFAALNAQQEEAYALCSDCFDWNTIGRDFAAYIGDAPASRLGGRARTWQLLQSRHPGAPPGRSR